MLVGLSSGTQLKHVVLSGILIVAISDAFSDALAMHVSEESGSKTTKTRETWESAISTFVFKLIFASSFIIPVLLFNLKTAVIVSIIWGLFLLTTFSYYISKKTNHSPLKLITEHVSIAILVIIITHFTGILIRNLLVV